MQPRCNTLLKWNHHWSFTRCGSPNTVTSSHRWTLPKFTHIRQNHTHTTCRWRRCTWPFGTGISCWPMLFKTVTLDDVMSTIPMGKETHLPQLPLDGICSQEGTSSVIEPHHQCDPSRFNKNDIYMYIYSTCFSKTCAKTVLSSKKRYNMTQSFDSYATSCVRFHPRKKKLHSLITNNLKLRWLGFQTRAAWDFPYLFRGAWEGKGWASFTRSCLVNKNPSTFSPLGFGPHIW